jgi:hypothetical protein
MAAVAYDQPVAVGVALIGELVDVAIHLGLQRFGQHPPGTLAHDLIDQRRTTGRTVIASGRVRDYGEHGRTFPSRRANADPDQNLHGLRSCSGGAPTSRHLAEDHPQVLIIARCCLRAARSPHALQYQHRAGFLKPAYCAGTVECLPR